MNDADWKQVFLDDEVVGVPASQPPRLEDLSRRVRAQRRRRRMVRSAASAVVIALIGFGWANHRSDGRAENEAPLAVAPPLPEFDVPSGPSDATSVPLAPSGVRVFAHMHQPVPVFDRVRDTDYLRHVGWIDSQEVISLDANQFPVEQRQMIQAVLDDEPQSTGNYFNL